jgi:hypothetical protein
MKNAFYVTILLAVVASPLLASAQTQTTTNCQMYTYSDQWVDEDGNLVALNTSNAQWVYWECGEFSSYADSEIQMPSGYSQSASASAEDCCAEAIAFAPMGGESGDGTISGTNQVNYSCGLTLTSLFNYEFRWGHTLVKMSFPRVETNCFTTVFGGTYCDYDGYYWCTAATSPPLYKATGVREVPQVPLTATAWYWNALALCERPAGTTIPWACIAGALDSPPMPPDRPPGDCTKE